MHFLNINKLMKEGRNNIDNQNIKAFQSDSNAIENIITPE